MKNYIFYEYSLNMKRSLNLIVYLLNFARFFFVLSSQLQCDNFYILEILYAMSAVVVDAIINIKTCFFHCFLKWSQCRVNCSFVSLHDVIIIFILLKYYNSWFFFRAVVLSLFCFLIYKLYTAICVISEMCLS